MSSGNKIKVVIVFRKETNRPSIIEVNEYPYTDIKYRMDAEEERAKRMLKNGVTLVHSERRRTIIPPQDILQIHIEDVR